MPAARPWRACARGRKAPLDAPGVHRIRYAYDDAGRIASLRNVKSDGTAISYFEYERLAGGSIRKITREAGTYVYYAYDDADRLVSEKWYDSGDTEMYAYTYDHDAAGNRTQEWKDGVATYYAYDAANELLRRATAACTTYYAYDENGSVVREFEDCSESAIYFAYGDHGLMTRAKQDTGTATYFHYDARLQKFAVDFEGTLRYFAWDGMNQIVEKDSALVTQKRHTHGHTPIEGIGALVVTKRKTAGTYHYQYPHFDHRGSLFDLEDTDPGVTDLANEFNAYGEAVASSGDAPTRFGYQGTFWMQYSVAGWTRYVSMRDYRPLEGRFGQRDVLARLAWIFALANSTPIPTA
jgi:YD repeat-containing protein